MLKPKSSWAPMRAAHAAMSGRSPGLQSTSVLASKGRGFWSAAVSPGVALAVSLMGYYALAGFTNVFMPEGALGGILIRAGSFALVALVFAGYLRGSEAIKGHLFVPAGLFFLFYTLRLLENFFIEKINIQPGPEQLFLVFIVGCILPSFMLARVAQNVRDEAFAVAAIVLSAIFLAGMALNLDALTETVDSRLTLDKINPIALAHTAASFLLFNFLFFRKSKFLTLAAAATTPFLFLIMVYARSRGPYASLAIAVLSYILLLKGTKRVWALLGITALAAGLIWFGGDYLDIMVTRFAQTDIISDESSYVHYIAAEGAWRQFTDDFMFGRYAIELLTEYYPHNIFLEIPMAVGIAGSLPFLVHIALATRATIGIIRTPGFSTASTLIAVLFIRESVSSAIAGGVWGISGFWISSFMVIAFWYGRPRSAPRAAAAPVFAESTHVRPLTPGAPRP